MINYPFARNVCFLIFLLACSMSSIASEGKPVAPIHIERMPGYALADTVPPVKQPAEEKAETDKQEQAKPATSTVPVIKVVPKARKQLKPVSLPSVPVKPVKIIKPVIKRVGSLIP